MPTKRARVRRLIPNAIPGILVVLGEVIVAVLLILYLRGQQTALCHQIQHARVTSNVTLRQPFRQFALEAAHTRAASALRDDKTNPVQRRIDLAAAAQYSRIAERVHDLPPLKC